MQLGFVGLGRMGLNMVTRLVRGGHQIVAYDRSADAVARAEAAGARGVSSLEALAQALGAPRAPAASARATASALRSKATIWWPPRTRRVTMLRPIRPRPTKPSCIGNSVYSNATIIPDCRP